MKIKSILIFIFCLGQAFSAEIKAVGLPENKNVIANEVMMLDQLIEASKQSLEIQIKLRDLILKYQELQTRYLEGQNDNEHLFIMAKSAKKILETIKENHLTPSFDPAFLGELTLISKPAAKRGIPKP